MKITGKQKRLNKEANIVRRSLDSVYAVPIQNHIAAVVEKATQEMYSDADVTAMIETERERAFAQGRQKECDDLIKHLEASEWDTEAQATAALDIVTMVRNGFHRVKP